MLADGHCDRALMLLPRAVTAQPETSVSESKVTVRPSFLPSVFF